MAAKKYDVAAVVGEKPDGKPRWKNCGVVLETDNGLRLKIDSMPVGKDFDGWFALFEPRDNNRQQTPPARPAQGSLDDGGDDIPFIWACLVPVASTIGGALYAAQSLIV